MYNPCHLGKTNWASKIRDILFRYGFGWIWENQYVPDSVVFMRLFSQRVRDCELQLWSSDLYAMPKLNLYNKYKEFRREELHLSLPIPRRIRADLARYRTSHSLETELGRHYNIARADRLCKLCRRQCCCSGRWSLEFGVLCCLTTPGLRKDSRRQV